MLFSCGTLQLESTGLINLNVEGVACLVVDGSGERNRPSEHLWIVHLVPLPEAATLQNPASTTHHGWVLCAHEPCRSAVDKQRTAMAPMLLSFVTQWQTETSKVLAPVMPVVQMFNRDSPHAK